MIHITNSLPYFHLSQRGEVAPSEHKRRWSGLGGRAENPTRSNSRVRSHCSDLPALGEVKQYRVASKGLGQFQNVRGDVREDEVRGNGCDLVEPRFAELALDVEFLREAHAAVNLQTHVGREP